MSVLGFLVAPGFFSSSPVRTALVAGAVVAAVSAVVGVFTVARGQSFAGHSLADVGTTGGSGAFLVGVGTLWGFLAAALGGAAAMELLGVRRPRDRDLATGIVLGGALGLAALFLYLDSSHESTTGATMSVLFGSIFTLDGSTVPELASLGGLALAIVGLLYRPLWLGTLDGDLARSRGVALRSVGAAYLVALAVAVAMACMVIGAILSTALLVGPAATSLRLTRRPGAALAVAVVLGVASTWLGVALAYDSYYWPPTGRGWPVSFFVVALVFVFYLLAGLAPAYRRRRRVL